MSKGTTLRNVRVDEELWNEAKAVAKENDETLSDVIRDALRAYVHQGQILKNVLSPQDLQDLARNTQAQNMPSALSKKDTP